jgi:hypothetical protein
MSQPTKKYQTYFVTATIEVTFECFTFSKSVAELKFQEAFDDADQRFDMLENVTPDVIKIEKADTHLGKAE